VNSDAGTQNSLMAIPAFHFGDFGGEIPILTCKTLLEQ